MYKLKNLLLFVIGISVLYIVLWYTVAEFIIRKNLLEKVVYVASDIISVDHLKLEADQSISEKVELSCQDASVGGFPFAFNIKCNKPKLIKEGYNYKYTSEDYLNVSFSVLLNKFIIIFPKSLNIAYINNNAHIANISFEKEREITFVLFKNVFRLYRAPDLYTNLSHVKKIHASFTPFNMDLNSNTMFGRFKVEAEQIKFDLDVDKSEDAIECDSKFSLINFVVSENALKELNPHKFTVNSKFILNKSGFIDMKKTRINADEFLKASLKGSGSLVEYNFDLLLQIYDTHKLFLYLEKLPFAGVIIVNSLIENSDVYNKEENKLSYRILFSKNKVKFGRF